MAPPPSSETLEVMDQGQQPPQPRQPTQDMLQEQVPTKPAWQSNGGTNSNPQTLQPSGFLTTVRNAASRTTDILGISSSAQTDSSNSNGSANGNIQQPDSGNAGGHGNVQANGTVSARTTAGDPHSATMSTAAADATTASSPQRPPLPPSFLPSTYNPTTAGSHLYPSSAPANTTTTTNPHTTQYTTQHTPTPHDTNYQAAAPPYSTEQKTVMDPSQTDLMTMESFRMNGDGSFNYDSQEYTDPSYTAGPGSFPDSYGAGGQPYVQGDEIGSLDRNGVQSNDGDELPITFVYANEKRFSDFHALFRSVPEDERLIEDYGCALQKEILVQGRLYISEDHICFNANIFGWVTNLVIAFSEITAIEKRFTAYVIPNAISIITTTNTKGHFFASFLSREAAHDLLMAAWRKSFPCAANASVTTNSTYLKQNKSSLTLNEDDTDTESFISARPTSDSRRNRHRRSSSAASQNWTADEAEWDEIEDMDGKASVGSHRNGSKKGAAKKSLKEDTAPIIPNGDNKQGRPRSVSELPPPHPQFDSGRRESLGNQSLNDPRTAGVQRSRTGLDSPPKSRPNDQKTYGDTKSGSVATHSATTCKCSKDGRHYASTFMSETYPGTVENMWKLLFESDFNKNFLTNEAMKGADVQEENWQKSPDGTSSKMTKYTKWLGMPIGPKTTKAILTDVCENKDFDDYVTTVTTTSTPDVPSGGSFTTKCRTCITWAGPNQVQVVVTGAVEFTKSSWIKGQIEKGAAEGMTTHFKELNTSIRKHAIAHPEEFAGGDAVEKAGAAVAASEPLLEEAGEKTRQRSHRHRHRGVDGEESAVSGDKAVKDRASPETMASEVSPGTGTGKDEQINMWSSITSLFSWNDSDSASHMALVLVLVLVMFANIYIWFQISNVTSQIEKIQSDVFSRSSGGVGGGMNGMHKSSGNSNNPLMDNVHGGDDDRYTQEQEEAMWAWLTEREERHRQYQRANAKDWIRQRKVNKDDSKDDGAAGGVGNHDNDKSGEGTSAANGDISATEAKLQARINELQQQLETLERALDIGAQGM
ncbi:hypothetical protein EDD21DRAFT_381821 [Dissophora ornata]|nr:hypothetical protein BGZ58_001311 [Dissophora ornata]KAI8598678.1 hypothetical protein EDD21DRAFT_381821 [Dissophora ornata]